MKIPNIVVDAFVSDTCQGNPAAVCPLSDWLDDAAMQAVAARNGLSETAFLVPAGRGYALRWFSPTVEVALCGHATLASAFVVFDRLAPKKRKVAFETRSGTLAVVRQKDLLVMDFPSLPPVPIEAPPILEEGLGVAPSECWRAANILAVFDTEEEVRGLAPDFEVLKRLHPYGVIATAPGARLRLRLALFRAELRHPGGPGDRIGALHPRALLGGAAGQGAAGRAPGLGARWRALL